MGHWTTGATGPTGPRGICECDCRQRGQLVVNGGMESTANDRPTGWTSNNTNLVSSENSQGRVHSGNWSVNLQDNANLSQIIYSNDGGCFYDFSFFARGEGSQVGLIAKVIFLTPTGNVDGVTITVRQQDIVNSNRNFAYYRGITVAAPDNITGIKIEFIVSANGGQSLDLDDVTLITL